MKLRNLFLASAAIAGLFTACSNEMDEAVDSGAQAKEEAYVSFAIQMPGSAATRATTVNTEEGSSGESTVSEVTLLFFDSSAPHNLTDIKTISAPTKASNYVYNTDAFLISKGQKLVYAFANAQSTIKKFATNDNGAAYKTITEGVANDLASTLAQDNKFTMSNADEVKPTNITSTTQEEALKKPITINIERTVAKVVYVGDGQNYNNTFPIKRLGDGVKLGDVTLTDMTLINANKSYYYLRRTSTSATGTPYTIGGEEEDGKTYVVDPNFTQNVNEIKEPYRTENFFDMTSESEAIKDKVFYCHENTMSQNGQYMGATTGVTFKAKFTFDGNTGTFYRFNGQLYKSTDLTALKKAAGITEATDSWNAAKWKAKNVDFYKDGICYYHYMIKHVNNNDPATMGVMEYGVVRNNVYKLNVTSINEIGANDPNITPETPDETEKAYIAVSVTVKEWAIRSNENIEL